MLLFNQVLLIFEFYFAFQSLFFSNEGFTEHKAPQLILSRLTCAKDDGKTEVERKGCRALHRRLETWPREIAGGYCRSPDTYSVWSVYQ